MEIPALSKQLEAFALSTEQATVYTTLLSRGISTASKLVPFTGLSRPMVYKILDELIALDLVEKVSAEKSVTKFQAAHPLKLRQLVDQEQAKVDQKQQQLESILGDLVSVYSALSGKPGVRILQGKAGVAELYEDILNEGADISLIRSPHDDAFPEIFELVVAQIKAQVKAGITTKAITPFIDETPEEIIETDTKNLVTRRLVHKEKLNVPAQIILYSDKVAITAFDQELMTTIIQNPAISQTFTFLFSYIWDSLEAEDASIRTGILDGSLTPAQ